MTNRLVAVRRSLPGAALSRALALFVIDRYAAYLHRPSADATRIVISTTSWCPYCARLRVDPIASGISYTEYDVEKSVQAALGL